jgi:hypothetical protein
MTARDLAHYRAGLRHAAEMALLTALALELRDDVNAIRQLAAIEALRGFAEGLKAQATAEKVEGALP